MTGKAKTPHQERNEMLSRRVADAVMDMGHGKLEDGIERFVDHALWVADKQQLRIWKGDKHIARRGCLHSLRTILGLNAIYAQEDWPSPGTNLRWVLDVWEASCDDWFRVSPPKQVEPPQTNGSVPISTRILEAYLAKDADTMLVCLGELEAKGL